MTSITSRAAPSAVLSEPGAAVRAHAARGTHWLIDCFGVESASLADPSLLEAMLCDAAAAAGATRLFEHFHRFGPGDDAGVTGVVLLAESHITIHTWPEQRFAAVDLFLCGATDPSAAVEMIDTVLRPERIAIVRQARGE